MDIKNLCRRSAPAVSLILLLLCAPAHGAPTVSATDRDSLQTDLNGDGNVNRGDTVRHTVTIQNSGDTAAESTLFTQTLDPDTTLVPGSLKTTPAAAEDSYNAVGNVRIQVPAAEGVLKNDFGIPAPTATVVTDGTSANGGKVTIEADGSFTYNPPAGFTGTDTFTYTAVNGEGSDTGTVTVTVEGLIWFVNAAAEAQGDGRLTSPFKCLVGDTCYSALAQKDPGDGIFLYSGNYTGGLSLLANQKLIGQGATASLAAIADLTPATYSDPLPDTGGTRPTITTSGLVLATGNTLRGFNLNVAGSALSGSNIGAFTAGEMAVNASGSALILANGTVDAAFTSVSSGGGTNNVSLNNINGAITIDGGSWSGAAGSSLMVSGGNVSLTYPGNITQPGNYPLAGVSGGHNGTLTFTGTLSATSGAGLQFANADGLYSFNGTTSLRGGAGIDISAGDDAAKGSQGVFSFGAGASIVDRAGPPFNMAGSRAQVTYSGSISQSAAAQPLVKVFGGDAGTLTFNSGTLTATNGTGLQFDNADGNYSFNGTTTLNGGDAGIDIINGSNGNFTFASSTSITNPSGAAIYINGGGGAITYNGTVSKYNAGRLADIQGRTGGSLAFSGDLTCSSACTGVYVKNTALAGTLSITGQNNTLSTTNAEALYVENTTIAAAGLAFKSISADGGNYGIYLNNTGATGGLTVVGDNGSSANGSGGTIKNIVTRGASFTNAAKISLARMNFTSVGTVNSWSGCGALGTGSNNGCNAGIHLQSVSDATLNYLTMNGGSQQGINGSSVTNFQLLNSTVTMFGDQAGEDGVRVLNLLGTSAITNSTIRNNRSRQVNIKNSAATPLAFTMTSCTLENNLETSVSTGEYLMQFSAQNTANMTGSIQGGTFQNNLALAGGFQSNSVGTSAMNLTINNSTFTSLKSASIDIIQAGSANVSFNVTNNNLTGNTQGNLINIYRAGSSLSNNTLSGNILNNNLNGSSAGSGISVSSLGMGTTTVLVNNNSVSGITQHGIYVSLQEDGSGSNTVNATVSNNRIINYDNATVGFHAIMVQAGTSPEPKDNGTMCASITGNTSVNGLNFNPDFGDSSSNHALRVRQRYLTNFRMPGYSGAYDDNTAVVSFLRSKNPATVDPAWVSATNNVSGGGGGFLGGALCPLPQ